LRGRDIKRYGYNWAGLFIIATFPALHIDIDRYPTVKVYLLSFGIERLEQSGKTYTKNGTKYSARKKTGNKWFETQDQIGYWEDFSKPKIVWGEISDKTKFAYDGAGDFYAEATTFLLTGKHLGYLVCFLNSKLCEYMFSKIGTTTGVGTIRWKKFKIEQLFVPRVTTNEIREYEQLLVGTHNNDVITSEINNHIYIQCGLSPEEIAFIEHYSESI